MDLVTILQRIVDGKVATGDILKVRGFTFEVLENGVRVTYPSGKVKIWRWSIIPKPVT